MRTNIEIDDRLIRSAMKAGPYKTKRETVEAALRLLVERRDQRRILELVGKVTWRGDIEAWRQD
ncbi:MAG: type II toxin-antitoxin system VapB family antitoxin [Alphaproteobacteria bacterium]|nr:type II toxin-antitoxin system VapB family antitoxin [Alphaproteobacteria bacterium]